ALGLGRLVYESDELLVNGGSLTNIHAKLRDIADPLWTFRQGLDTRFLSLRRLNSFPRCPCPIFERVQTPPVGAGLCVWKPSLRVNDIRHIPVFTVLLSPSNFSVGSTLLRQKPPAGQ